MTYGSSIDLGVLITSIADSVSVGLKSLGLEVADTWVNSKVSSIPPTVPDLVEKAATYYAYVFILKNLYDTTGEEDPMMDWYEQQAKDLLGAYVEQTATEESTMHPYSGNLTPTNVFTQRNKRTSYDNTDYDNVREPQWESEE
jgi:hypothetical protein